MSPASNTTYHSAVPHDHSNTAITLILTVSLFIIIIVGFLSIYFCQYFLERLGHFLSLQQSPAGNLVGQGGAAPVKGLDPAIINAFPSFVYSTVKEYRKEKYGLECAICLCEFQDTDVLRLLTSCSHVFHQDCIDLWLGSHQSCPVCRRIPEAPVTDQSPDDVSRRMHDDMSSEHSVRITIEEDDHDHEGESEGRKEISLDSIQEANEPRTSNAGQTEDQEENEGEKFSRSTTTGHSIIKKREVEENQHTLMLPDHINLPPLGSLEARRLLITVALARCWNYLREMVTQYKFFC
ncbi:hypothetical protein DCAR_0209333 [Daucus carota subsp. sativus]|uniref:RING-type E3 ubiquitin transferase n=1 Tax=Daucus carota subsp. sativus TaxID=79200 RepID=A0AAF1ARC5_DAUCS|nr:PREDICTED: RING-H2 finger protein ATL29-like [Daucus carota subsp. sativus]WOG90092.1 hypothetical protein DCAR_0209333 [Daucus carota subsp. sativus]